MKKLLTLIFIIIIKSSHAQFVIDQSNIGSNTTRSRIDNQNTCLQTFTTGNSGELGKITVDIETEDCPYPLVCKILDGGPNGNIIATEFVDIPTFTSRYLHEFIFTSSPFLNQGKEYSIALYSNCIDAPGKSIWWYKSVNNSYLDGEAYNLLGLTLIQEDTLNDFYFQTYFGSSTSIYELQETKTLIYPNPASNNLIIDSRKKPSIEIFSLDGKLILTKKCELISTHIDVSNLAKGVYAIYIKTENGIETRKITID